MTGIFVKDPTERLDYVEDWSDFLGLDTITGTPVWTVPTGLTKYSQSNTTTTATVWLTGGTHGEEYLVTGQITTTGGRIAERTIKIICRDQ